MCGCHSMHGDHGAEQPHPAAATGAPPAVHTTACPQCGYPVQADFVFCPGCGAELLTACPACHRAVRSGWTHCAYCGADLLAGQATDVAHAGHS
jgi:RNA polymerase subunit RPABC4/transcription elongation factor Spt4